MFLFGLELHVSYMYDKWVMALNVHYSLFPIHHSVHVSIITPELWLPEVVQAFSRLTRSGKPGSRCGLHVGMSGRLVWLSTKICFSLIYPLFVWPHSQTSIFENMQATILNVHCNLFSMHHFVHVSRCNICGKVTGSGCGWKWVWLSKILLFFSSPICICNHQTWLRLQKAKFDKPLMRGKG